MGFAENEKHQASGDASFVSGRNCVALGKNSSACGNSAKTQNSSQHSLSGGSFLESGDSQITKYILRNESSGSVPSILALDGVSELPLIDDNISWTFTISVIGRSASGEYHSQTFIGSLNKIDITPAILTSTTIYLNNFGIPLSSVTLGIFGGNSLKVEVTSGDNLTMRWSAVVSLFKLKRNIFRN